MQELYTWGFRGLITLLFIILWFWTKRWINQQDSRWEKHDRDRDNEREVWAIAGGLVTREQYYAWCANQRAGCSALNGFKTLQAWRENAMEKGGILLKNEHSLICKEITNEVADKFCDRLDEMLKHHREWVGQELKILRVELTKTLGK